MENTLIKDLTTSKIRQVHVDDFAIGYQLDTTLTPVDVNFGITDEYVTVLKLTSRWRAPQNYVNDALKSVVFKFLQYIYGDFKPLLLDLRLAVYAGNRDKALVILNKIDRLLVLDPDDA